MTTQPLPYTQQLKKVAWPIERLTEAVENLARQCYSFSQVQPTMPFLEQPTFSEGDTTSLENWLNQVADRLGVTLQKVSTTYAQTPQFVRGSAPAIIPLPAEFEPGRRYFLLVKKGGPQLSLLAPDLSTHHLKLAVILAVLRHPLESPLQPQIEQTLIQANIPTHRHAKTKRAMLHQLLAATPIDGGWLLTLPPGQHTAHHLRQAKIPRHLLVLLVTYILEQGLFVLAWGIIGKNALTHQVNIPWLITWAFLMFTIIPVRLLGIRAYNQFSTKLSTWLKQRLFFGILQLKPDEVRHQGAGQFFGQVIEVDTISLVAITGGITTALSVVQIGIAAIILSFGSGGTWQVLILLAWLIFVGLLGWRFLKQNGDWLTFYRNMTNDLIERMVGQRTRLAQENQANWHDEEDYSLNRYWHLSQKLDQTSIYFNAFIVRGWLVVSFVGVINQLLFGEISTTGLALTLGGILFASQALRSAMAGIQSGVEALLVWQQIKPLYQAASRGGKPQPLDMLVAKEQHLPVEGETLLTVHQLNFAYPGRLQSVLSNCRLEIKQGDHILLQGASGAGKSTLATLLSGLRQPDSGLLLWQGLDQASIGLTHWRQNIVVVPQSHENHILTAPLAFNLLMGYRWPPTIEDLKQAQAICYEVGLGDLLEQMPAGLQQIVGESGWQLSHGERSRIFIARALLQKANLLVVDENFETLDPHNLLQSFEAVFRNAQTILIIAHP